MATSRLDLMAHIVAALKAQATAALSASLLVRERALHLHTRQTYVLVEMYDLRAQLRRAPNVQQVEAFYRQFEDRRAFVANMPRMDDDAASAWRAASLNAVACINLFLSNACITAICATRKDVLSQCVLLEGLADDTVRASDSFWKRVDEYEKVRLDCTTVCALSHHEGDAVDVAYGDFMSHFEPAADTALCG